MSLRARPFGSTGVDLPEIGLGFRSLGRDAPDTADGPAAEATGLAAVARARELGVEVFDIPDPHGREGGERMLAKALGQEGTMFTRVGLDLEGRDDPDRWRLPALRAALEGSLDRLGRDQVDLFQLHNPSLEMVRDPDTAAMLGALRDEGLTRWTGLSVQRLEEALAVVDLEGFNAVELPLNILRQDLLTAVAELSAAGIAVVAREPLASGFLTGDVGPGSRSRSTDARSALSQPYQALLAEAAQRARTILADAGVHNPVGGALSFVLAHEVSVVLPGARTPEQVEQNVRAPYEVDRLPAACLERLYELGDELHG